MADIKPTRVSTGVLLRWIARVILVLWALFWLFFNIGSGIEEIGRYGAKAMLGHFAMAAIILLACVVAWFFEGIGGVTLIVLAFAACYVFRIPAQLATSNGQLLLLTLVLPAVIAGVLLIVNRWAVPRPGSGKGKGAAEPAERTVSK